MSKRTAEKAEKAASSDKAEKAEKPVSADSKLDLLISSVDALTRSQAESRSMLDALTRSQEDSRSMLETHLQRFNALEGQVTALVENQGATSAHLASHDHELNLLRISANMNEQLLRSNNARILGFPVLEDEAAAVGDGGVLLRDRVFNRLLKPVFEAAVRDRFLLAPPAAQEAVMRIYRTGRPVAGSASTPPPIVITFATPIIRQALFRYKSKSLPSPNTVEKSAGAKRFFVVEDLTKPVHRLLKTLQAAEGVAKVWTVDGSIRFTKTGNDSIHKVINVFDPIDKILSG